MNNSDGDGTFKTIFRYNETESSNSVMFSQDFIPNNVFSLFMQSTSWIMVCAATFGFGGNVLIIVTYAKIGLSESINIHYLSLGVSDALFVLFLTWNGICSIPSFADSDIPFLSREFMVPTGGHTSAIFQKTTSWITAFISLERCLCVVFPLKIKTIVNRRRTIISIVLIFFASVLPLTSITFYTYVFEIKFDAVRNKSLLGARYRKSPLSDALTNVNYIYKLVFLNTIPFAVIILSAVVLAFQLHRSASWRLRTSGESLGSDEKAHKKYAKDLAIAKTVLAIAVASIILGTLNNSRYLVAIFWPEFHSRGTQAKLFLLVARLMFLLSFANSSINFIIYYRMGTRFRITVRQLLFCDYKKQSSHIIGNSGSPGGDLSLCKSNVWVNK